MKTNPVLTAVLALAVVAASSCATQRIVSQWSNPAYANPLRSTDKVVVVGVMEEEAIRRNFEDHLVVKLRAAGIDALPGYRTIPQTGVGVDARLKAALQDGGADAALITRLVRLEQRSEVSPGYSDFYPGFGFYRWSYPGWYGGGYFPPVEYRYPVVYSETTLYNLRQNDELVWTATIRTIDPEDVEEAIRNYVDTVVDALKIRHLIDG